MSGIKLPLLAPMGPTAERSGAPAGPSPTTELLGGAPPPQADGADGEHPFALALAGAAQPSLAAPDLPVGMAAKPVEGVDPTWDPFGAGSDGDAFELAALAAQAAPLGPPPSPLPVVDTAGPAPADFGQMGPPGAPPPQPLPLDAPGALLDGDLGAQRAPDPALQPQPAARSLLDPAAPGTAPAGSPMSAAPHPGDGAQAGPRSAPVFATPLSPGAPASAPPSFTPPSLVHPSPAPPALAPVSAASVPSAPLLGAASAVQAAALPVMGMAPPVRPPGSLAARAPQGAHPAARTPWGPDAGPAEAEGAEAPPVRPPGGPSLILADEPYEAAPSLSARLVAASEAKRPMAPAPGTPGAAPGQDFAAAFGMGGATQGAPADVALDAAQVGQVAAASAAEPIESPLLASAALPKVVEVVLEDVEGEGLVVRVSREAEQVAVELASQADRVEALLALQPDIEQALARHGMELAYFEARAGTEERRSPTAHSQAPHRGDARGGPAGSRGAPNGPPPAAQTALSRVA